MAEPSLTLVISAAGNLAIRWPSGRETVVLASCPAKVLLDILRAQAEGQTTIGLPGAPTQAQLISAILEAQRPSPSKRVDAKGYDKDVTLEALGL